MDEYINREAVYEYFDKCNSENPKWTPSRVKTLISRQKAADVAPVRHGRWIEREKYTFGTMYDCSICDNRILDNGHSWNYCPNCGAIMDGGDD